MFGGCATTDYQYRNNYTNNPQTTGPRPDNYEKEISTLLGRILKDPYSLRDLSISDPVLSSCRTGTHGTFHGWMVTVTYNAKNSYGAYVGLKTEYFWYREGKWKGISDSANLCPEAPYWKQQL